MEIKKISSAGDPDVVRKNRMKIDPLLPSIVAVLVQLLATLYLLLIHAPIKSIIASAIFTLIYIGVTYILNRKSKN